MRNVVRSLSLMALSFGVSIRAQPVTGKFCPGRFRPKSILTERGRGLLWPNHVLHNQVISYARAADGSLLEYGNSRDPVTKYGLQLTDPLESQGSLVLSQDHSLSSHWQLTAAVGKFLLSMYGVLNLLLADRVVFRRERAKRDMGTL